MLDEDDTPTTDTTQPAAYTPVTLKARHDGWTVARQRTFLTALAETGSISMACTEAGISARSAYRLRARSEAVAFAAAWEHALKLATIRLVTIAFERATRGAVREHWKDGELVGETRVPSDKILMFILSHLMPNTAAGNLAAHNKLAVHQAGKLFPLALDLLTDSDVPLAPLGYRDVNPVPPEHDTGPSVAPGDPQEDW